MDWMELQWKIITFGAGLSGYFTSDSKIYLLLIVILPFFTISATEGPLIPKALSLSLSILPGRGLGMTIKLVINSPLQLTWKGLICNQSFWKNDYFSLRYFNALFCSFYGISVLITSSIFLKTLAKSSLLLSSMIFQNLLIPFLDLPPQLQYDMGTTLKPILYLNSSKQWNSFQSTYRRELQLSPRSQRVRSRPVRPVMVAVDALVKKQ